MAVFGWAWDEVLRACALERRRPRAYVALGSFLSARSDVLRTIADALRCADLGAVVASGVTPPADLGPLPEGSIVRPYLPQVAALRACDVAICHGGNNTAMEALTAEVPVVALPFSTDQFAVAADLVDAGLGAALDPNRASAHDLASLDVLVCESPLGVAENGAVWISTADATLRAALFLAARVVIVVREEQLVDDLHQAYARIDVRESSYGAFVAGPSKTAVIEQSLVVGAHGPKALTLVLVREAA